MTEIPSGSVLGLTIGPIHFIDHKFDPIWQANHGHLQEDSAAENEYDCVLAPPAVQSQ